MSYGTQQTNYRELEVRSASPERLVCIVFDHLVVNLERARLAMERNDIELRVSSLRRARGLVTELLVTLDVEKAGSLGVELAGMYQVMLGELVDVGVRNNVKVIKQLVHIASNLRDGFVGAESQLLAQRARSA